MIPGVSVEIDYFATKARTTISEYEVVSDTKNNICSTATKVGLDTVSPGASPFVLGASPLGSNDTLRDVNTKYNGYFSNVVSDANGAVDVTIKVRTEGLAAFVITFDTEANQYAKTLSVDEETYENDDVTFHWMGDSATEHVITIKEWSAPLYPVRVTSILSNFKKNYTEDCIKELRIGSQAIAEDGMPSYGIVGQYGSIVLYDVDGEILDFSRMTILRQDIPVTIFFNRPSEDSMVSTYILGTFLCETWNYKYGTNEVTITLLDPTMASFNKTLPAVQLVDGYTWLGYFKGLNVGTYIMTTYYYREVINELDYITELANLDQAYLYMAHTGDLTVLRLEE
jgi:hypothetical protein